MKLTGFKTKFTTLLAARLTLALPLIVLMSVLGGTYLNKSDAPHALKLVLGSAAGLVGGSLIADLTRAMIPHRKPKNSDK